ncbi:MAG: diaminopimelate decarboxylase [Myxococcaceae bacterium]
MNRVQQLATVLGEVEGSELSIGRIRISDIAERVSTPFYVYSGEALQEKVHRVRAALGEETAVYFSLKANPSLALCQILAREGVGAELASIGELHLAQRAGFPARRVIFAGPGKTEAELEFAIQWGIESINVESVGELERIAKIATARDRCVRVCLRINPSEQVKGAQMRMTGGPSQFGIDEEQVPSVLDRFGTHPNLRIVGIHVYVGSQLFDIPAVLAHCHNVLRLGEAVSARMGRPLEVIDFGGGFAVPYFENSPEFDLEGFSHGYREVLVRMRQTPSLADARPIIELGRYLVAEAGLYVTRVVDVKTSRGVIFAVTDGGMNHHITATGNFGQVFRKPYPVAVLNRMTESNSTLTNVVGPCCTPLDVIGQQLSLPEVAPGDLIGIFYSGAYGYSASSLGFLSHPTPAEALVYRGQLHILRPPGAPDDVVTGQRDLEASESASSAARRSRVL